MRLCVVLAHQALGRGLCLAQGVGKAMARTPIAVEDQGGFSTPLNKVMMTPLLTGGAWSAGGAGREKNQGTGSGISRAL